MARTYTEIVEILAPESAVADSTVNVAVAIKNTWSATIHVYCVAVLDSESRFIDWLDAWVNPGVTHYFNGSFVMPNKDVRINVYSYWEDTDGYVHSDDSMSKDVKLAELAPQVSDFSIADYVKV